MGDYTKLTSVQANNWAEHIAKGLQQQARDQMGSVSISSACHVQTKCNLLTDWFETNKYWW